MTEKYIDLHGEIADSIHWDATVADTLKWLDDHPDRVPGPRMTYSELAEEVKSVERVEKRFEAVAYVLTNLGFTICSDPEPTNAELLVEDLAGIYGANLPWTAKVAISEALTERGWVKAPGGD